jgi:hypothetical protein
VCECVSVCVCERERDSVYMHVCVRENVCVDLRGRVNAVKECDVRCTDDDDVACA